MKKKLLALVIAIALMFGAIIPVNAGPGDGYPIRPIRPTQIPIVICDCDMPAYDCDCADWPVT